MGNEQYLTYEGAKNLRAELERLKGPERDELAKRLRSAIQMGDLSENADYHAAKEYQAFLEGKIQELEFVLKNAVIIEELKSDRGVVTVGTKVTIQEANYPPETYDIVGAKEADPKNGRISNQSPFGAALLGGKEGEEVIAETPAGQISLKILKIE
ncbi:MAG: transcription elongation factor GreA [Anaerolineales bacterium]|nr:transcription elongation factor GreA [Anaerolineales bacterium]